MRKLLLPAVALLAIPAIALGGQTVTVGTNTLQIKSKFKPAKASKKNRDTRPLQAKFDYVNGTTDGSRLPDIQSVEVNLGGPIFGFGAFPTCKESEALEQGASACDDGSAVGKGNAIAEIHPPESTTSKTDFKVNVQVFNGELDLDAQGDPRAGKPGLLIYTEAAGARITIPMEAVDGGGGVILRNAEQDPSPGEDTFYGIKEIHLKFPVKTIRRPGHRIPFVGAPSKCKKAWVASATNTFYEGEPITATHRTKCKKA